MSLLNKKYTRQSLPQLVDYEQLDASVDLLSALETEANFLTSELVKVEDAKNREGSLRARLAIVVKAHRDLVKIDDPEIAAKLPQKPEPTQVQPTTKIRKAAKVLKTAPKDTVNSTEGGIANDEPVFNNEGVVNNDFSQFPD